MPVSLSLLRFLSPSLLCCLSARQAACIHFPPSMTGCSLLTASHFLQKAIERKNENTIKRAPVGNLASTPYAVSKLSTGAREEQVKGRGTKIKLTNQRQRFPIRSFYLFNLLPHIFLSLGAAVIVHSFPPPSSTGCSQPIPLSQPFCRNRKNERIFKTFATRPRW